MSTDSVMSTTKAAAAAAVLYVVCLLCTTDAMPRRSPRYFWPAMTTTPPMTTTIRGCVTDTGNHLQVGESHNEFGEGWCRLCECTFEGLICMHGDCLPPMCVDYVVGDCCYYCPNGQNCRLPSGEIITAPVERDGMRCECPEQEYYFPGVPSDHHTIAICTPTMTTTTTRTM